MMRCGNGCTMCTAPALVPQNLPPWHLARRYALGACTAASCVLLRVDGDITAIMPRIMPYIIKKYHTWLHDTPDNGRTTSVPRAPATLALGSALMPFFVWPFHVQYLHAWVTYHSTACHDARAAQNKTIRQNGTVEGRKTQQRQNRMRRPTCSGRGVLTLTMPFAT